MLLVVKEGPRNNTCNETGSQDRWEVAGYRFEKQGLEEELVKPLWRLKRNLNAAKQSSV